MPVKALPEKPNLDHLKAQAKDLLSAFRRADKAAVQRITEFHPRINGPIDLSVVTEQFTLSDAQLSIAREYGFTSWPRLHQVVNSRLDLKLSLPHHERIEDLDFRRAVDLLDEGAEEELKRHLSNIPRLVTESVHFEGENYFQSATLLEFVAENPTRHERLPANIANITRIILDMGAHRQQDKIDSTLGLVCSGRVARECGVQLPLIDLLCEYGADPNAPMEAALVHGEFEAAHRLIDRGARIDLVVAAALGNTVSATEELPTSTAEQRHRALAMSTQHGHVAITQLLLSAGENPSRYNPVGFHAHSTPLHQAALAGNETIVRLLIEHGADTSMPDILHSSTACEWARHGGHTEIAEYIQRRTQGRVQEPD